MRRNFYALTALALTLALSTGSALAQSFGGAVAVSGGEVFVAESQNAQHPGAVFVYRPGAEGWDQAHMLEASDAEASDNFGTSLAVDGMTMLVGAPSAGEGGAAYVFTKTGMNWAETARLSVPSATGDTPLGGSVALSGDIALLGQSSADSARGAVHVFMRQNGAWQNGGMLMADGLMAGDRFGGTVALSESGTTAYVGATRTGESTGAVYVFDWADGAWTQSAMIQGSNSEEGDRFGGSIATYGDDLLMVTSMRYQQMMGQGYVFMRDAETGEYSEVGRVAPFDGASRTLFGASLDFDGETLVVGAIGQDGFSGTTYVFEFDDETMTWTSSEKVAADELSRRGLFGMATAIDGDWMVAGASGAMSGAGLAYVFRDTGAGWMLDATLEGPIRGMDAITGQKHECADGTGAAGFDCAGMDLLSFVPTAEIGGVRGTNINDIWGWTDPDTGQEWALVGRTDGTSFVDVTDPVNPVYAGDLPLTEGANPSTWRDIKVYQDHAYIVADNSGEHGMQVFDLTRLRDASGTPTFTEDFVYRGVNASHNVFINEDTGFAYIIGAGGGGETCGGGLHMVDIREPKAPTFAGCFADTETGRSGTGYSHDVQCVLYNGPDSDYQGSEICFGSNETALSIADVTDKDNPVALSSAPYPNVAYAHQGWLTDDQRFFYSNDELDEMSGNVSNTRTLIWDVSDLEDPQLVKEFLHETTSIDHNLYIDGNLMYQSNYADGLRVFDITDIENPVLVSHFDTTNFGEDGPTFIGSWSNFPYFASGTIVVSSIGEGLFVLKKQNLDL